MYKMSIKKYIPDQLSPIFFKIHLMSSIFCSIRWQVYRISCIFEKLKLIIFSIYDLIAEVYSFELYLTNTNANMNME